MSPPRVVFAPHLLQTLDSRKQPLRCTNLVRENVRASRTPGEAPPLRDRLAHPRLDALRHHHRDRRRPPGHPGHSPGSPPRTIHPPTTTPQNPRPELDQPTPTRTTDDLNSTCLT